MVLILLKDSESNKNTIFDIHVSRDVSIRGQFIETIHLHLAIASNVHYFNQIPLKDWR